MAQPAIAPFEKGKGASKGRGRGRGPPARGGHSKAGPSAPAEKVDAHHLDASDDDDNVFKNDSTSTEKSK